MPPQRPCLPGRGKSATAKTAARMQLFEGESNKNKNMCISLPFLCVTGGRSSGDHLHQPGISEVKHKRLSLDFVPLRQDVGRKQGAACCDLRRPYAQHRLMIEIAAGRPLELGLLAFGERFYGQMINRLVLIWAIHLGFWDCKCGTLYVVFLRQAECRIVWHW